MTTAAAKIKYKKTGLDWMPEVPEHWKVRRLKNIGNVVLGKMLCNNDKGSVPESQRRTVVRLYKYT